jgi:ubiquitin C-terminal hydrolase
VRSIFKICIFITILTLPQYGYSENKGLEWGNNSCYFDASIQALSTLKDFNEDLGGYNPENCPPASTYLKLINAISGKIPIAGQYLKSDYKIEGGITLRNFHLGFSRELEKKSEPAGQKDAAEFIGKILNDIEIQIPKLKQVVKDNAEKTLREVGFTGAELEESIQAQIGQLFDPLDRLNFYTLSSKVCEKCGYISELIERHNILILNFKSQNTLNIKDLLISKFSDSQISDYKCDSCHNLVECKATVKIARLPKYLIIYLCRFDSLGTKISTPVVFAFEINLKNVMDILSDDVKKELIQKPLKYRLNAVVVHGGASVNSGHYWAYAKYLDAWHLYNDQHVSDAGKQGVLNPASLIVKVMQTGLDNNILGYTNATPYVLFYELTEVVKGEPDLDIIWPAAMPVNLQQKLVQLKTSLHGLKAKLEILRSKLTVLSGKL